MSRPHRPDPFETLVELTAAAVSRRPPPDFVYEAGPSVLQRLSALLHRVRLPDLEAKLEAANEPDIHESKLLQRYY